MATLPFFVVDERCLSLRCLSHCQREPVLMVLKGRPARASCVPLEGFPPKSLILSGGIKPTQSGRNFPAAMLSSSRAERNSRVIRLSV